MIEMVVNWGIGDINGGEGDGYCNDAGDSENVAIVVDCQVNVVDGTGDIMSDDVGDVGMEGDCNDDDGNGDGNGGCGDNGSTMTLLELSKIEYPWLK